jgi:endonuclease/exonuclease/phosphatase family metal-dependent hydrolase
MITRGYDHVVATLFAEPTMIRIVIAACLFVAFVQNAARTARGEDLYVAGWNCENLFDTEDDPKVEGDEEYTPDSPKHWTKERLNIKLDNLSSIIRKMNDDRGPDVLGVCEVENRKVVEMLVEKLKPLGRKYEVVHKDSPSERGIDCAIIFDSAVFTLIDSKFHHVDAGNTRDIVEAKLERKGKDLYVFMDHWPSRHHDESYRIKTADVARKRLDDILAGDKKADVIMLGDFNDESTDESIRDHLRAASAKENLPTDAMFDTTAWIRASGKGTFVYNNQWDMLDHIFISSGLLDRAGYQWKDGSSQRVEFPEQFYKPRAKDAFRRPSSSYSRNEFHKNGYSDHLPLGCKLVLEPSTSSQ